MHAKFVRITQSFKHICRLYAMLLLMILMHACVQQEHYARIWCMPVQHNNTPCTHCQNGLSCNNAGMLAYLFLKAFEGAIWLALVGLLVGLARSPP